MPMDRPGPMRSRAGILMFPAHGLQQDVGMFDPIGRSLAFAHQLREHRTLLLRETHNVFASSQEHLLTDDIKKYSQRHVFARFDETGY
jgi:hypothetical protein